MLQEKRKKKKTEISSPSSNSRKRKRSVERCIGFAVTDPFEWGSKSMEVDNGKEGDFLGEKKSHLGDRGAD